MKEEKNQIYPNLWQLLKEEKRRPKFPPRELQKTPAVYTRSIISAARLRTANSRSNIGLTYNGGKLRVTARRINAAP